MTDYDRRKEARGSSFKDLNRQLLDHLGDADSRIGGMEGLIHYRLFDSDGKRKDRFKSDSLVLDTPDKKQKAEQARALLLEMRKALGEVVKKRRELERLEKWLDENLDYV